jgi:hypothetical protein
MSLVKSREKRTEDAVDDRGLMCRAHGCPMKWSVQTGEVTACSYHAWEDPKSWPQITDRLIRNGPWNRPRTGDSATVKDMKTRLRGGFKFTPPEPQL